MTILLYSRYIVLNRILYDITDNIDINITW